MRFVKSSKQTSAGELRGDILAHVLGVPCETDSLGDAGSGETVIFVKFAEAPLIGEAKARGCRVVLDVIDYFCLRSEVGVEGVKVLDADWYPLVDILIVPNHIAATDFLEIFPKADFVVIPHQWDYRLDGYQAPECVFTPGYIGASFNLYECPGGVEVVSDQAKMIEATPRFNCHIAQWSSYQDLRWKPATKISNAAAVGANCVCSPSASAIELMGEDYPYFIRSSLAETLARARRQFGNHEWHRGLEIMRRVKQKTSLQAIASKYLVFEPEEATA